MGFVTTVHALIVIVGSGSFLLGSIAMLFIVSFILSRVRSDRSLVGTNVSMVHVEHKGKRITFCPPIRSYKEALDILIGSFGWIVFGRKTVRYKSLRRIRIVLGILLFLGISLLVFTVTLGSDWAVAHWEYDQKNKYRAVHHHPHG